MTQQCWICPDTFKTRRDLKNHLTKEPHGAMKVICPWCETGRPFRRSVDLMTHIGEVHKTLGLDKAIASEINGFWFSLRPGDYQRLVSTPCYDAPLSAAARDAILKWLEEGNQDVVLQRTREEWIEGWAQVNPVCEDDVISISAPSEMDFDIVVPEMKIVTLSLKSTALEVDLEVSGGNWRWIAAAITNNLLLDPKAAETAMRRVIAVGICPRERPELAGQPVPSSEVGELCQEITNQLGINVRPGDLKYAYRWPSLEFTPKTPEPVLLSSKSTGLSLPSPKITGPSLPSSKTTGPSLPSPKTTGPSLPSPKTTGPSLPSSKTTGPSLLSSKTTGLSLPSPKTTGPSLLSSKTTGPPPPPPKNTGPSQSLNRTSGHARHPARNPPHRRVVAKRPAPMDIQAQTGKKTAKTTPRDSALMDNLPQRALHLIRKGSFPALPPARREWARRADPICFGSLTLTWPPKGWTKMSPDRRLLEWEMAAMRIEGELGPVSPDTERQDILEKYNMLALPGTADPRMVGENVTRKVRVYNYRMVVQCTLATSASDLPSDANWMVKMLEATQQVRDVSLDPLLDQIEDVPLRLEKELN